MSECEDAGTMQVWIHVRAGHECMSCDNSPLGDAGIEL